MQPELATFYELVEDIEVAMMTTRRADGHLESRAMATQKRASGADLWFVAAEGTGKLLDLQADPHVNLAYYKDRTREWVSVSGLATLSRDRDKIHELYAPDWKIWFAAEGDEKSVPEVIRRLGNDIVFYASDVPHWDHDFPDNIRELATREDLSVESKRKILYENTRRLYELAPGGSIRSGR